MEALSVSEDWLWPNSQKNHSNALEEGAQHHSSNSANIIHEVEAPGDGEDETNDTEVLHGRQGVN